MSEDISFEHLPGIEGKLIAILKEARLPGDKEHHHLSPPFLSPYQIAIKFVQKHPDDAKATGLDVGGAGTGKHTSLSQRIAKFLSQYVRNNPDGEVEGAFLAGDNLRRLEYDDGGCPVVSSVLEMSIYRHNKRGE